MRLEQVKNKKILILSLLGLLLLSTGISFAYFVSRANVTGNGASTDINTAVVEDTTLTIEGVIEFSDLDVYPGHKNVSKLKVTATGDNLVLYNVTWTGTNTLNTSIKYYIYKTTTDESPSITCNKNKTVQDGAYIYYEECTNNNFTNLGEVITTGSISTSTTSTTQTLLVNEEIQATSAGEVVYYYVVLEYPNVANQNTDLNGSLTGEVGVEIIPEKEVLATEAIEGLYATNTDTMAYDEAGNLRYIGANPNNYVTFNGETWRIIGVFSDDTHGMTNTKLIKLIRNESIGNYAWDTKTSGIGSSISSFGSNDWSDARLMMLLNPGYESNLNKSVYAYEGSLYYNAKSGTCYGGYDFNTGTTDTISCDFSTTGLKDSTSKSLIESVFWKTGGITANNTGAATEIYNEERGTTVYAGHTTETEGKVGLMYMSDYVYATAGGTTVGRTACLTTVSNWYDGTTDCYTNDWLFNSDYQWTLTPDSLIAFNSLGVNPEGSFVYFIDCGTNTRLGIRPSIYLKSTTVITGGDGTSSSPFELSLS